jgi:hypothetical protein
VGQGPVRDNKQHSQETSVYVPAGFELAIPKNELLHTHDLDPVGTGVGKCVFVVYVNYIFPAVSAVLIPEFVG